MSSLCLLGVQIRTAAGTNLHTKAKIIAALRFIHHMELFQIHSFEIQWLPHIPQLDRKPPNISSRFFTFHLRRRASRSRTCPTTFTSSRVGVQVGTRGFLILRLQWRGGQLRMRVWSAIKLFSFNQLDDVVWMKWQESKIIYNIDLK